MKRQYGVTLTINLTGPKDCEDEILKGFEKAAARLLLSTMPVRIDMTEVQIEIQGDKERVSTVSMDPDQKPG